MQKKVGKAIKDGLDVINPVKPIQWVLKTGIDAMTPKKPKSKVGLPPGTLVYTGEEHAHAVRIGLLDYDAEHVTHREDVKVEECFPYREKKSITWIDIDGVHDLALIEKLGARFGLHPLILEDIAHVDQRPKVERYDNCLFVVLRMVMYDNEKHKVQSEQVSLILGENFVISFQEGKEGDVFDTVRHQILKGKGKIRQMGADFLLYALLDAIVDNYFTVLDHIGERIEDLEEELVTAPISSTLQDIHLFKREMIILRKNVWPLRDVINTLERRETEMIREPTQVYLRDLYDHIIRVVDTIETNRDLLAGMIDVYLSSVSNKMNSIMKVLTVISTIFIPLTFLAGVYGMNFEIFPELHWAYGYVLFWALCIAIAAGMTLYFKKKDWF